MKYLFHKLTQQSESKSIPRLARTKHVSTPALKIWPLPRRGREGPAPAPQPSSYILVLGFKTGKTMLRDLSESRTEHVCRAKDVARRLQFQPGGELLLATYESDATKTWLAL